VQKTYLAVLEGVPEAETGVIELALSKVSTAASGEAEITTAAGASITGTAGQLVEFEPRERHAVRAISDTRLLLLLTPWPGRGHPGAMSLEDKAHAVADAAERRG
jgi:hypothetical protein